MINALVVLLQKNSPIRTDINFKLKRYGEIWGGQDRRATSKPFKALERLLAVTRPNNGL